MWFPRLASDRVLRACPRDAPFALIVEKNNTVELYCLNQQAERQGLHRGMRHTDARIFCPDLQSSPADPQADQRFLHALARWARRYCPWVGLEGGDGLVMDITGVAHLFGGEAGMLVDIRRRLARAGLAVRIGLADTRGAAWALAHHGEGVASGEMLPHIGPLPVAALRLDAASCIALERLGLRTIGDLAALPRAALTRRFGQDVLMRLDQALGDQPEQVSPLAEPPHYRVRLTLPEPIGLSDDVMAGTASLLERLCARLKANEAGARVLCLTLGRVDQASQQVELRLARPLRDAGRILPLFKRGVDQVDAGFGIERLQLVAAQIEPLPAQQISHAQSAQNAPNNELYDLITRIGSRIGLENVRRFLPADSHIPERDHLIAAAAFSEPAGPWISPRPRPGLMFRPEPISGDGPLPPRRFRWRRMALSTARATGPERIAPEWWMQDDNWHRGIRDYWHVETLEGRRLWLFHTPQNPGWFVQGEFA